MTPPAREPLIQLRSANEAAGPLLRTGRRTQNQPRWLPFEAPAAQVRPRYLAFADADSLAHFLRARGAAAG
ncbi:MAG: hypothetical protein H0U52_11925 [Chloroflexi bacterium]|nr:hypothetical protein [Chloroflexota bacterium]